MHKYHNLFVGNVCNKSVFRSSQVCWCCVKGLRGEKELGRKVCESLEEVERKRLRGIFGGGGEGEKE